jgi:hypothetical protein
VVYHNKSTKTRGRIKTSVAYLKQIEEGRWVMAQKSLIQGLKIPKDDAAYLIFRDRVSGLEYIHSCQELHRKGLYVELQSYQVCVFQDFRVVYDRKGNTYSKLASRLGRHGVLNVEDAVNG